MKGRIYLKVYNFNLKYLEIALYKVGEIDESEFFYVINLIKYFNSVEKYSDDFPVKFVFIDIYGQEDDWYDDLKKWLIESELCTLSKDKLILTSEGKAFFQKLEKECLKIAETFTHYDIARC